MTASLHAASQPDDAHEQDLPVRTAPHALPPRPALSAEEAAEHAAALARSRAAASVTRLPPKPPVPITGAEAPPALDDEPSEVASDDAFSDVEEDVAREGTEEAAAPGGMDAAAPVDDASARDLDEGTAPGLEETAPELGEGTAPEREEEAAAEPQEAHATDDEGDPARAVDEADDVPAVGAAEETEDSDARDGLLDIAPPAAVDTADDALGADVAPIASDRAAGVTADADAAAVEALAHVFDDQPDEIADEGEPALALRGVSKRYGRTRAVDAVDLTVPSGTFYGIVGPNGAGKTTTLSMIAGLLRPDQGVIRVAGVDALAEPRTAKSLMGVLPDRLRTFDRLTGRQLLYYYGTLRGLPSSVVETRTADLARAFDLTSALGRAVSDYSAGMTKKVMLAGAMIHAPRVLVLDEPFESVDPVSSAVILDILRTYVGHGGTVVLSSHGMELVESVCSRVAVIVAGQVLAEGTVAQVRGELTLEQRFVELAGGLSDVEGLEWLHTYSD